MKKLNRNTQAAPILPERILQFGGGNFLRGFVDWMVDVYNEKTASGLGIVVVKPTAGGDYEDWRTQDGLFYILTKGIRNGALVDEKYLVKCISRIIHPYKDWEAFLASAENPDLRYIISNTTENGIRYSEKDQVTDRPPHEFPAKLTLWLHHRYQHFNAAADAGCVLIPTELLIDNGLRLKESILQYAERWQLGTAFEQWINTANVFCNTLVDRIIPGVGKNAMDAAWQQIGFQDTMVTQGEPYHFWAIEAPQSVREEFPIDTVGLNVVFTDDITPFRTRKVRILNGAHTAMVPVGYLYGIETVKEAVEEEVLGQFIRQAIFDEIIPTIDMPETELLQFANDVLDRFQNPFIRHELISISLNGISKFKTRLLPSVLDYKERIGVLPKALVFSLASLIRFYKGEYDGKKIPLNDDLGFIEFLSNLWKKCDGSEAAIAQLVDGVLTWEAAWKMDLSRVPELKEMLTDYLLKIEKDGQQKALKTILS